jgi:hypothetical protein
MLLLAVPVAGRPWEAAFLRCLEHVLNFSNPPTNRPMRHPTIPIDLYHRPQDEYTRAVRKVRGQP